MVEDDAGGNGNDNKAKEIGFLAHLRTKGQCRARKRAHHQGQGQQLQHLATRQWRQTQDRIDGQIYLGIVVVMRDGNEILLNVETAFEDLDSGKEDANVVL